MRATLLYMALSLALPSLAHAAACCGGGSAAPTILSGDDQAQLSATLSQGSVIGDAPVSGAAVFRADGDSEQVQTLRLDGAFLLSDRWQVGESVPIIRRARSTRAAQSSATGVGDIGIDLAYEWLPDWDYSNWRPRGFAFVQTLFPFGGSVYGSSYDLSDPWGLDARGRGFFALEAGTLLTKSWGDWDASLLAELHRSFDGTFVSTDGPLQLSPGWGGSAALSGGYNFRALPIRLGLSLSPLYEDGVRARSAVLDSTSNSQMVWNVSAQIGWLVGHDSTFSAVYADQTLLGPASNVSLSRTISLAFQHRWER